MILTTDSTLQTIKRIEDIETRLSRIQKPELGKQLVEAGFVTFWPTVDYNYDNNLHTPISTSLTIPAGGVIIAELTYDLSIIYVSGRTGHEVRIQVSTAPDVGITYDARFPYCKHVAASDRQNVQLVLMGKYNNETSLTLSGQVKNWNYTVSWLKIWSTWTKLQWRIYA